MSYAPEVVTLAGTVLKAQAYGAPGYGENPATDAIERYESLSLDQSICVLQSDDDVDVGEADVRQVQLVGAPSGFAGRRAHVTGTLFHQVSGHHHTKVLLQVRRIDP